MEMYNVPEQGHAGAYMIQGAEPAQITSPLLQNFETMFNEGVPEFVVDQGLYYPTTTNYSYLCTGFESPSDWDDHQRIFGLNGQDIQYMGAPNENLPYMYYTPNYEYAESAYNPYNPYIPGAVVGVDGLYLGAQQYYTISAYENNVSSPSYFPVVLPNTSDVMVNRADTVIESNISAANRADGSRLKHNLSSASPIFTPSLLRPASGHNNFNRGSESAKYNARSGKQPVMHGNIASDRFSIRPSEVHTGKVSQATRSVGHGKALSNHVQLRASVPSSNDSSHLGSGAHDRVSAGKGGLLYGRVPNDVKVSPDSLNEQNRGPRTNRSKNQLVVKAYTSRAGNVDAQGNIVIHADEYNRDNFQLDLLNAKFFVIKSYSEDDVHKSIKYNVWSSTPNGNKKLNSAFEDAQRVPAGDPRGCPVFLLFSVNASGQFCGVAEMTGPVNFYKDMDFWQQDKWSGSFPVKWHIIKDVPNPNFRHIILENNENKPVTNSRDTQEIHYKKGIEMLKVFKNYASGTSLLDDFMYYESRQKFLQEEKAKLLMRSYENPFFVPVLDPPRKLNSIFDFPSSEGETISKHYDSEHTEDCVVPAELDFIDSKTNKKNASDGDKFMVDEDRNTESALRIASLTINPKDVKSQTPEAECTTAVTLASAESVDVVTVGSMPVKVNGFAESSGFISIGTIPLDPRALQRD